MPDVLEGYRGHPGGDVEALRELLLRLSALAESVPVIPLPPAHGCRVVDARIKVRRVAGTMR
jgi:hypothetical protein